MDSESPEDYYRLLEVAAGVDDAELRRAWRRLATRWHPDRAGPDAKVMFQQLSAAYVVLSDPVARAAYDRRRGVPVSPARTVRAPAAMLHRVSGHLNTLLACGVARRAAHDVIELLLDDEEVSRGGIVTVSLRVSVERDGRIAEELFSAWLTVPPGVADGAVLLPSVPLRGMLRPVQFRVRAPAP